MKPAVVPIPDMNALMGNTVSSLDRENEWYKAMQKLYDGENLHFISDISDKDIIMIVRLAMIKEWLSGNKNLVPTFIEKIMQLRVSRNRKGRGEFFDAIKQPAPQFMSGGEEGMNSWFRPRK